MKPLVVVACLFTLVTLISCEREVHINVSSGAPQLVVEGRIDNGFPPIVTLTTSIGFFSNVDFSTLQNSFVHGAIVKVSEGADTTILKEYTIDSAGSKFYLYTLDTADPHYTNFFGKIEHYYSLTIIYNQKTYTATTKIPNIIPIDSMRSQSLSFTPTDYPDAMQVVVYFKDPDTPGNYARYYTKRNSEPYYAGDLYNDQITNGIPVNWHISPGKNTAEPDSVKHFYFYKGDTVTVAWSSIDKGAYDFWNTFQYASENVGNPFASPINPKSNISNGAVGVWAGYGTSESTFVIPK